MSNECTFRAMADRKAIQIRPGSMFVSSPAPLDRIEPDRLAGIMLGIAIGDALGNTSEGMNPAERKAVHGEIHDYLPNRYADWRPVGVPSDDSQMAFWTLEQLIEDGGYVPERVARKFCAQRIFGIGSSVRAFVRNHQQLGLEWHVAGTRSAGNGALMRIAPIVYPHLRKPTPGLWVDTALSAMTTHNDNAAIASSLAFVAVLWDLLAMSKPPRREWWSARFCEVLRELDDGSRYEPRGGAYMNKRGGFADYVEYVLQDALQKRLSSLAACESFYSGAYLLETVPSVLHILSEHGDDPEEALVRAVNDTRDNDTVAAIVGAAVGALHGRTAIPARWRDGLSGRTGESDDGRMFELIDLARRQFLDG